MKKRLTIVVICIIGILMCLFGCAEEGKVIASDLVEPNEYDDIASTGAGLRRTVVYLGCDEGYVIPIMRMIPWEEGIGKAALSYLIDSPENTQRLSEEGLFAPIPYGAQVSLRITDEGSATVSLNGIGDLADADAESTMITAVVNTLLEFPTINNVSMMVNGKTDPLKHGTALPQNSMYMPLNVMMGDRETITVGELAAHEVYFTNMSGSINIPITIYGSQRMSFKDAVSIMINGVDLPGIRCCFPSGTTLIEARIEGSTAVVNLGGAFSDMTHFDGLDIAAYETLFLTALEFESISELVLLINGTNYFSNDTVLPMPVFANELGY